ncbi:MAG: response regulator, partial [bacterium]|nr:response regulator [bacterium]
QADTSLSNEELVNEFAKLGKEYNKLLKQIIKITRIGDVNQRKLKEQSEKLKEMDKVKSRFFTNISHEFRTPLTLIMGPLEQMLSECRDNAEQKRLNLMLRNAQRLLGLINQLLALSKFAGGKVKLQAARLNIVPFLKGITASFEPLAIQKEVDLNFRGETPEILVYFDPAKLEEVLFNVLSNSVKFTPAGGKITIALRHARNRTTKEKKFPSGTLEITVSDTGPGIPGEHLDHIFDRFYQVDNTYAHHSKGSGIGLAIARQMVELHHGTIGVQSRQGENSGTEFIIRLPIGKEHLKQGEMVGLTQLPSLRKGPDEIRKILLFDKAEKGDEKFEPYPETAVSKDAGTPAAGKDIILVVEDDSDVRAYIKVALKRFYSVVEAVDGEEGIQKCREIIPDLVISDVKMPRTDGFQLCRTLKGDRKTSHIPIILLTAKAAEENIIEGLKTGADDYITKPFNTEILVARIKNLIGLRRHLQETINREMTLQPTNLKVSHVDKELLKELKTVIEANISDPDFNVEELGRKLYMSHATLYRKIHAISGESPTEFIRSYRLKRGAELLKNNFGSVLETALEVGFSSANYFTKCFKKKFHQLPSSYKEIQ